MGFDGEGFLMFRVGEVGGVLPKANNAGVRVMSSWADHSCMGSTERERQGDRHIYIYTYTHTHSLSLSLSLSRAISIYIYIYIYIYILSM